MNGITIFATSFPKMHDYRTSVWGDREVLEMDGDDYTAVLMWLTPIQGSVQFNPVAQSRRTLRPHESQHARPPCPSPTPGVHPDSRPSSQ